jgi:purine-binding chemotaxis protein CheW
VDDVHVRLRVGDELYALPIEHVLEITEVDGVAAVPGAGAGLLGVRNLHGQVLPVYDLALVFGVSGTGRPERVVVAERSGVLAGLAVDDVTDVAALPAGGDEAHDAHLRRAVLEGDLLIGVVDVERMFALLGEAAA